MVYKEESEDNSLSGEGAKDDKSDIEDGAEDDKSNFEEDAEDNKTNTQEEEEESNNNASWNDGGDIDQSPSTSTKKKVLKKKKVVSVVCYDSAHLTYLETIILSIQLTISGVFLFFY